MAVPYVHSTVANFAACIRIIKNISLSGSKLYVAHTFATLHRNASGYRFKRNKRKKEKVERRFLREGESGERHGYNCV